MALEKFSNESFRKFLDELPRIIDQPQGHSDELISLLVENVYLIVSNSQKVGDALTEGHADSLRFAQTLSQQK
jgi:hypothetical protein